jgi:hypothetical protein
MLVVQDASENQELRGRSRYVPLLEFCQETSAHGSDPQVEQS